MTRLARRSTSPRGEAGHRPPLAALIVLLAGAAAWTGCSIEKNYELLSFFFDGVPAPASISDEAAAGRRRPGGAAAAVRVSAHTAYLERRCAACHGDSAKFGLFASGFTQLDASVCMQCHEQVLAAYPRIHGPVAAEACLWCHQPHESPHAFLLAAASPDVCLQCHRLQMIEAPPQPHHEDLQRDCLECHLGHGGSAGYFLRSPEASVPHDEPPEPDRGQDAPADASPIEPGSRGGA